jgi:RND superfamily putative drug exporter
LAQVRSGLTDAQSGVDSLIAAQQRLRDGVVALADRAGQLANGADQLSEGTRAAARSAAQQQLELSAGLQQAADFLQTAGRNASGPGVGGFYLPPGALDDPRLALARGYYLSQDGKTARFVVIESTDPMGREAAARVPKIIDAATSALRQTSMEGSRVESTGPPAVTADADRLANQDLLLVAMVTFLLILLVLVIVLRALVAPLYLLVSVAVSYVAAIGASVLVWQMLLGLDLDWVVPMFSFVVLVAVGVDYNILLMTRIREEAPDGSRKGIAHVVDVTGGVITSAGIILAASFLVMLSTDVRSLAQTGFTIGVGLLLDTFVVRGIVVPAIVSLTGRHSWWPARESKQPCGAPSSPDSGSTSTAAGAPSDQEVIIQRS